MNVSKPIKVGLRALYFFAHGYNELASAIRTSSEPTRPIVPIAEVADVIA